MIEEEDVISTRSWDKPMADAPLMRGTSPKARKKLKEENYLSKDPVIEFLAGKEREKETPLSTGRSPEKNE
jgi:hypothetical protein